MPDNLSGREPIDDATLEQARRFLQGLPDDFGDHGPPRVKRFSDQSWWRSLLKLAVTATVLGVVISGWVYVTGGRSHAVPLGVFVALLGFAGMLVYALLEKVRERLGAQSWRSSLLEIAVMAIVAGAGISGWASFSEHEALADALRFGLMMVPAAFGVFLLRKLLGTW
jgi:hypothetical protein